MKTISRRSLLRSSPVIVAGAAGLSLPIGATSIASFQSLTGRSAAAQSSSPRPTGAQTLRLAGPLQGPQTLDPALTKDLPSAFLVRQIYRSLMRLGPDLQPVPELAEAVTVSDDGLVYTFTLRQGLKFHDGRDLLADDIVYSLTRALSPDSAGGQAALLGTQAFLGDIDGASEMLSGEATTLRGATAPDEATVEIRLTAPRAAFLMKIASAQASIVDRETVEADPAEWWRRPNGTGPFKVEEWEPDDHMTLVRFDDFHAGAPVLEKVEVALGPNASNSFNLYQADQLDIDSVPYDSVSRALDPSNTLSDEVVVTPSFGLFYVAFRTDVEPLDDPEIRRAVVRAFPRDRVAELTFDGKVNPAPGVLPHGMLGRDWPVETEPFDLEAARASIAASRYKQADAVPPIEIYTSSGSLPITSLRDVIKDDLGLTINIIEPDWPEFVDGLALGRFPSYAWYWGADYPDPENIIWTLFGEDSADNYVGYRNDAMNDLIAEARQELDPERRGDLYAQANQLLIADHAVIPFYFDVLYTLAKSRVRNLEVTPQGIIRIETVWMEH